MWIIFFLFQTSFTPSDTIWVTLEFVDTYADQKNSNICVSDPFGDNYIAIRQHKPPHQQKTFRLNNNTGRDLIQCELTADSEYDLFISPHGAQHFVFWDRINSNTPHFKVSYPSNPRDYSDCAGNIRCPVCNTVSTRKAANIYLLTVEDSVTGEIVIFLTRDSTSQQGTIPCKIYTGSYFCEKDTFNF